MMECENMKYVILSKTKVHNYGLRSMAHFYLSFVVLIESDYVVWWLLVLILF